MNALPDGAWVHHDYHGPHYAVVLRNLGDYCVIVRATSSEHRSMLDTCEQVWPDDAEGRILGLTARTYFYANSCTVALGTKLTLVRGRCPPKLFIKLRKLCEPQLARLVGLRAAELDALILGAKGRG